jgi:hypothetical protein
MTNSQTPSQDPATRAASTRNLTDADVIHIMRQHGYNYKTIDTYIADALRNGVANTIGPVTKIRYSRNTATFSIVITVEETEDADPLV